ncbi:MAG: ATP-binding protein [Kofleriaceae bacterium]
MGGAAAGPAVPIDVASLWAVIEAAAEQVGIGAYLAVLEPGPPAILRVTPRAAQIAGRTVEEMVGSSPWSMLSQVDLASVRELAARNTQGAPVRLELTAERPDGTRTPVEIGSTRIQTATGLLSFGYIRDLRVERDAIEALGRSEARFRYVVEAAPDGVVILVQGRIAFINPRAAMLLAESTPAEVLGKPIMAFLPPADAAATAERIGQMFRTGQEMPPNDYRVIVDPARVVEIKSILCDWEGKPAVLAFARDVTARRELAEKLVEADRLTALGTLAAGVAHEINNPLTYAQLSLQRVERTLAVAGLSDELRRTIRMQLADAHHGIDRVATITSSLRMFARPDDAPPGPIDVVAVATRAVEMVDNDLRHRARFEREIASVPHAIANASRLEQVIVNLLLNALQALQPDAPDAKISLQISSGDGRVTIHVRDNGRGIPEAVRARVFDPFFTTKPIGEGMGLGLSVCKSIIEGFGGTIDIASAEGAGTAVTVALRAHAATPAAEPPRAPAIARRRHILVVDDDLLVRRVLGRLVEEHHEVTLAENGAAALAAIQAHSFDAILCDMMMPGLDGREVHRRIALERPGLERRIVFITGGTFGPELDRFLSTVGNRCLTKPFQIDDVLAALEDAAA